MERSIHRGKEMSQDKSVLFPKFAGQLVRFEAGLVAAGLSFGLFMGLRTWAEQDALYAQGRTKPGQIVTNAKGGDSWHCYGLAADYVLDGMPDKPGLQWSWNTKADLNHDGKNDWLQMARMAVDYGLEPGYFWKSFPDLPHVQNRFGLTLAEAKEFYRLGGLSAVWAKL